MDDVYKQLKSTSDFLKQLISKNKTASVKTMMKLKIPCVSILSNCMTLNITRMYNHQKGQFIEARSCVVPTTMEAKKDWIKVFEFMAYLKQIVEDSLKTRVLLFAPSKIYYSSISG